MAKKKFKDTKVGQFLLSKIPNVVGAIAEDTPVGNVIEAMEQYFGKLYMSPKTADGLIIQVCPWRNQET